MRRPRMRARVSLVAILLVAALGACNQPDPTARREEGVYGSSSGPNPNLEDIQRQTKPADEPSAVAPASPAESAYPSQAGVAPPPPTDSGRGSAETGATDDGDEN